MFVEILTTFPRKFLYLWNPNLACAKLPNPCQTYREMKTFPTPVSVRMLLLSATKTVKALKCFAILTASSFSVKNIEIEPAKESFWNYYHREASSDLREGF